MISNFGKITLTEAEVFIIKNAMKEHLDSKGMGLQHSDVFDATFMETCGQEARVMTRLANWLEYQQQLRDEEDARQEAIKNGEEA